MLSQSIDGLDIKPGGVYVDVTFGGGGHSLEILRRMEGGRLIAFDQDEDALANKPDDDRLLLLNQNFRFLRNNLLYYDIESVDGIIADLGVSFHQFDSLHRGFSFRGDGPLDMRMNRKGSVTAAHILNSYSEEALASLFYHYGEFRNSRAIARSVVEARTSVSLQTISQLVTAVSHHLPARSENKVLARLFQALRIEVNREMEALRELLEQSLVMLATGGRLVFITWHSLEDRLVKNFMRSGSFSGEIEKDFYGNVTSPFRLITKKVITPEGEELMSNPRARSARLRVAEKR